MSGTAVALMIIAGLIGAVLLGAAYDASYGMRARWTCFLVGAVLWIGDLLVFISSV